MKNVLVIDRAENCSFSICLMSEKDFKEVFPKRGQNVEFVEDLMKRAGEKRAGALVRRGTTRRIRKEEAMGVHGTLFFQLPERRKYFPNKREEDVNHPPILALKDFEQLKHDAEMLQDIRAYDAARSRKEEAFPADVVERLLDGENRGLTQEQLAKAAKIARPYLTEIESGKKQGSVAVLKKLARVLKVGIEDVAR